jgi:glutathione S-transferase
MQDPTDKIVIYGHQASRASRPYWLLREYEMQVGEDFLEVDTGGPVTGFNDVRDTPAFLTLNPYRLIPVMKHGDLVLYESQAICQYIADLFGGPMAGQTPSERARITMYGLNSISNFERNLLPMVFGRGGEEGRAEYTTNLQPLLSALDSELDGREYLIGEGAGRFTVADIMMASVVGQYGRAIKFDFDAWPNVRDWVQLTTRRPAFYPPRDMKVNPRA